MKKIIFKIISLILIAFFLSTMTNEKVHSWSALWGSHSGKNHPASIWEGYKRGRQIFMDVYGNGDPCWKVGQDSSETCDINWLVPGLVNMALSIGFAVLAATCVLPGLQAFFSTWSAIHFGISVYLLEHISRVQWLADIQLTFDILASRLNWLIVALSVLAGMLLLPGVDGIVLAGCMAGYNGYYQKIYHFDKVEGQTAIENGAIHEAIMMQFLTGTGNPGAPHIRRYLDKGRSLAILLHQLGDFHSHTNFGYCIEEALVNGEIDETIAQLGGLRIMEIALNGDNLNLGPHLSITNDQKIKIKLFYNKYLTESYKLFANSEYFEHTNVDDIGDGRNKTNSWQSALNNIAWYWSKYLHINGEDN